MARVTVEDCVERLPNRFELVLTASQRAREIGAGAPLTVPRDNDKNPVVSLREIADQTVSIDDLQEDMIRSYQKVFASSEEEESGPMLPAGTTATDVGEEKSLSEDADAEDRYEELASGQISEEEKPKERSRDEDTGEEEF